MRRRQSWARWGSRRAEAEQDGVAQRGRVEALEGQLAAVREAAARHERALALARDEAGGLADRCEALEGQLRAAGEKHAAAREEAAAERARRSAAEGRERELRSALSISQEALHAPPPPRTKWTCRVPHPVLIGHAAVLTPY